MKYKTGQRLHVGF